jgi:hypothetical protein
MNDLAKLKDIKNVEFIQVDFLPYYIGFGLFLVFILLIFIIYFRLKKAKKKATKRQLAVINLKKMNFNNSSKTIAYNFTINGKICLNEKFEDEYNSIVNKLKDFKYKRDVKNISNDLIDEIKEYIKARI